MVLTRLFTLNIDPPVTPLIGACLEPRRSRTGVRFVGISLGALVLALLGGCRSLKWDYQIPNGGDEGDSAEFQATGPIPGLDAGEAVAFLRNDKTQDFLGPFPTSMVEIPIHDPLPRGRGTTNGGSGRGKRVQGDGAVDVAEPDGESRSDTGPGNGETRKGGGRGGIHEGGGRSRILAGRGRAALGGGRGTVSIGGGRGSSDQVTMLVVRKYLAKPGVYRRGDHFDLIFDCKNTGEDVISELVLVDHLDPRLLVSNRWGATLIEQATGQQVRWQKTLKLVPGKSTRFRLTCRVKPRDRAKKALN